jgi:hypothetical protein
MLARSARRIRGANKRDLATKELGSWQSSARVGAGAEQARAVPKLKGSDLRPPGSSVSARAGSMKPPKYRWPVM